MRLSIADRLVLPSLCRREGSLIEMALLRDVITKVQLPTDLMQDLNFHETAPCDVCQRPTMTVWDFEKAKQYNTEISFTKAELDYLKGQVQQRDREHKTSLDTLDICLRVNAAEVEVGKGAPIEPPAISKE